MCLKWRSMSNKKMQITNEDAERLRGLVISTARLVFKGLANNSIAFEDLVSEGWVGLLKAAGTWDPSFGVPFEIYARGRMQGAMKDHLRALDVVPRSAREAHRLYEKVRSSLESELGRHATRSEIAAGMDIDLSALDEVLMGVRNFMIDSIDAPSEGRDLHAIIPDKDDHTECFAAMQFSIDVRSCVARLPSNQRALIEMRYFLGMRLKDIGRAFNVSESRASQIHTQALGSLRAIIEEFNLERPDAQVA